VKQIGGELSGHFKETMTALFDAPANYEAWSLHEALNVRISYSSFTLKDYLFFFHSREEKEHYEKFYLHEPMLKFVLLSKHIDEVRICRYLLYSSMI